MTELGGSARLAKPLCGEREFAALLRQLAVLGAPRLFAIAEECGDREDGWITAWGVDFGDHAEVFGATGRHLMSTDKPENAMRLLVLADGRTPHLVWLSDPAHTDVDHDRPALSRPTRP